MVVVLTNGSALAVNWAKRTRQRDSRALVSRRRGRHGGRRDPLRQKQSRRPSCRDLLQQRRPASAFRRLRNEGPHLSLLQGTPLYPFGYGLSYTKFAYSDLNVAHQQSPPAIPVSAEVTSPTAASSSGDEVVQLYLSFPTLPALQSVRCADSSACTSPRAHRRRSISS